MRQRSAEAGSRGRDGCGWQRAPRAPVQEPQWTTSVFDDRRGPDWFGSAAWAALAHERRGRRDAAGRLRRDRTWGDRWLRIDDDGSGSMTAIRIGPRNAGAVESNEVSRVAPIASPARPGSVARSAADGGARDGRSCSTTAARRLPRPLLASGKAPRGIASMRASGGEPPRWDDRSASARRDAAARCVGPPASSVDCSTGGDGTVWYTDLCSAAIVVRRRAAARMDGPGSGHVLPRSQRSRPDDADPGGLAGEPRFPGGRVDAAGRHAARRLATRRMS